MEQLNSNFGKYPEDSTLLFFGGVGGGNSYIINKYIEQL
jgi:hypothetical protein